MIIFLSPIQDINLIKNSSEITKNEPENSGNYILMRKKMQIKGGV